MKKYFLIIGAMKAGSTTLYSYLQMSKDIYMPEDKEPEVLTDDKVLEYKNKEKYLRFLGKEREEVCVGEASTAYSKYPDFSKVPERAYKVFGGGLKIIYITRDPMKRALSHLNHDISMGEIKPCNAKKALFGDMKYVNYSNYDMQVKEWLKFYREANIKVISFEEMIDNPKKVVEDVCEFLGAGTRNIVYGNLKANASDGKQVPRPFWRKLITSKIYRRKIKKFLPKSAVKISKIILSNKTAQYDIDLCEEHVKKFQERLKNASVY